MQTEIFSYFQYPLAHGKNELRCSIQCSTVKNYIIGIKCLLNIYACKVLIEFLPRKILFRSLSPLTDRVRLYFFFVIIFRTSWKQRASERKKLSQLWLFFFFSFIRNLSDGNEHDEDQVGNVISNIACNSLICFLLERRVHISLLLLLLYWWGENLREN